MAKLIDDIKVAWAAMRTTMGANGFKSVSVLENKDFVIRAGRLYPENCESLLFGFNNVSNYKYNALPSGEGFVLTKHEEIESKVTWIVLSKKISANIDFFVAMVEDLVFTLQNFESKTSVVAINKLIERVRAWQFFMRSGIQRLSEQDEIGLFGELYFITQLIDNGMSPESVIASWTGPLGGVRDFEFTGAALEVKTTLSVGSFNAKISSLEQLDDTLCGCIYFGGVCLTLENDGKPLQTIVQDVIEKIENDDVVLEVFNKNYYMLGI